MFGLRAFGKLRHGLAREVLLAVAFVSPGQEIQRFGAGARRLRLEQRDRLSALVDADLELREQRPAARVSGLKLDDLPSVFEGARVIISVGVNRGAKVESRRRARRLFDRELELPERLVHLSSCLVDRGQVNTIGRVRGAQAQRLPKALQGVSVAL